MSRFVFHGRKQPSSRSNLVHRNSFIKSGLKSNTSCTFVLICKKAVVYIVNEHHWSHLFNLCSSFNDKSTLLDPGIGVLLAQPHTEWYKTVCQFKQIQNSNNSLWNLLTSSPLGPRTGSRPAQQSSEKGLFMVFGCSLKHRAKTLAGR